MIEYKLSLASSGAVKAPGYEDMLRFGYNKNCGVYRLRVTVADEWKGMKLRVFWHTLEGDPPTSTGPLPIRPFSGLFCPTRSA